MASPTTLDFESLLRPISDEQPGGVELRADTEGRSLFFQVKEAREAARGVERRALHGILDDDESPAPVERPDWQLVRQLATRILTGHSKDLWVCAWLIEALTRLEGFAGLRDGFRLTRELAEIFWDTIHPEQGE